MVKDISNIAQQARIKAFYLRNKPARQTKWNYEQVQTAPDVLEEIATQLERLVAKHCISLGIDGSDLSRQCKTAIRREISRSNATL